MPDGGLRLYLALEDSEGMLAADPTWTQIPSDLVAATGVTIDRGRQDEFNRTGTGTANTPINDISGDFDPTNPSAAYPDIIGRQGRIDLYNPVTTEWQTIFRGFTDDEQSEVAPSKILTRDAIPLVDGFDYLTRAEAAPGLAGDPPPSGAEGSDGMVFYEDGSVQVRIIQALTDAGWPSGLRRVFTGNIDVQPMVYDPGSSFLSIIQDAADAEFPDVANTYMDRLGRFCFHGRFSRFTPDDIAAQPGNDWDFHRWKAGDGAAIADDPDTAQIRELGFAQPTQFIYNVALAYPKGLKDIYLPGQVIHDLGTSIARFGVRPWSAPNLIVQAGTTTGNNAKDECKTFAQYIVDNYAAPVPRLSKIVFKSLRPDDHRAAANWELITKIDISDIIALTSTHPGGGGFGGSEFYVEGLSYLIRPLNGDYAMVTLEVNVSPVAYYNISV
jgi:hypothetical protein